MDNQRQTQNVPGGGRYTHLARQPDRPHRWKDSQWQTNTGRYTHPAKYGLVLSDMEQDLEGAWLAVHAVVNPLVDGKQSRLFLRLRVRLTVIRRRQLTCAPWLVDEVPDLGNSDVGHSIITSWQRVGDRFWAATPQQFLQQNYFLNYTRQTFVWSSGFLEIRRCQYAHLKLIFRAVQKKGASMPYWCAHHKKHWSAAMSHMNQLHKRIS